MYLLFVSSVLALTAIFKLLSVLSESQVLSAPYPFLPFISTRVALFIIALFELSFAYLICRWRSNVLGVFIAAWVGGVFFAFQALQHFMSIPEPCNCLGFVGDWLGLSHSAVNLALFLTRTVIAVPSLVLLCVMIISNAKVP